MKREEIIAKWMGISARERDAWVEREVFGGETFGQFREVNGVRVLIPHYTTDIYAAWAVLERNGIYGSIAYMGEDYRAEVWARWDGAGASEYEYAVSLSASESICLAAITARLTEVSVDVAV
ncbi:hypothetical protein [Paenibacillus sp. FSL K6-2859]|uniref:hypothetical protein n=1 Tax=Paenibacillus sp. FSL K6-2859 TaxID=2921482 RepID=UPI0030FB77D2